MLIVLISQKHEQFEIEQERREDEEEEKVINGEIEEFICDIETNKEQLLALDCARMSGKEVTDVDRNFVKVLTESPLFFLKELNMTNPYYWSDEQLRSQLLAWTLEQKRLVILSLQKCSFSPSETTQVFEMLIKNASTLKEVDLSESCNFSSDESCNLLAHFVSTALDLEWLNITQQKGERKVQVCIQYAVLGGGVDEDGQRAIATQGIVKVGD